MNNLCVFQVLILLSMILIQSACDSSLDIPLKVFNSTTNHINLQSTRDKRQIFM